MKTEIVDLKNAAEKLINAITAYQVAVEKMEAVESFATRAGIHTPEVVFETERLQADASRLKADVDYWKLQIQKINA